MSVGSKVIFLVLAVGLQSLFNGDSIGCAYAKPTFTVQDGTSSPDFYKSLSSQLKMFLNNESDEAEVIAHQNPTWKHQSGGFLNTGARVDILDDNNEPSSEYSGPGAFSLQGHNTVQISNSNMTTNTGSWITYRKNKNNSKLPKV